MVPASVKSPLRIGIAGLGTVGAGVIRLLTANAGLIAARAGRAVKVTAVSARDASRARGIDLSPYAWVADMAALPLRDDLDIIVELVGGADGPALALARAAIAHGKPLITANKAMIAHHGVALAAAAEAKGVPLRFEAAVAGGIPVIKGLREGAAANRVERIYGILNGTCNYILTEMEAGGADFDTVLAAAQRQGFAETDPAFDVEGVDAAHKLSILASIAFGTRIDFTAVDTAGITRVLAQDIAEARALGFVIRLIGMAEADGGQGLFQRVQPHLVRADDLLAHVRGPTNAVVVEGDFAGKLLFQGAGAGEGPTASAVVADIIDIARGMEAGFEADRTFSVPVSALVSMPPADAGARMGRAYIRFQVADRTGVLAEITAAMRDAGVSIESLIQRGAPDEGGEVLVVIVTHAGPERAVAEALRRLEASPSLAAPPLVMHILDT